MSCAFYLAGVLAENVKRLRVEQGLSKISLSRMSGLSRPTIDRVEEGASDVMLSAVEQLADALCVEPTDLLAAPHGKIRTSRLDLWF